MTTTATQQQQRRAPATRGSSSRAPARPPAQGRAPKRRAVAAPEPLSELVKRSRGRAIRLVQKAKDPARIFELLEGTPFEVAAEVVRAAGDGPQIKAFAGLTAKHAARWREEILVVASVARGSVIAQTPQAAAEGLDYTGLAGPHAEAALWFVRCLAPAVSQKLLAGPKQKELLALQAVAADSDRARTDRRDKAGVDEKKRAADVKAARLWAAKNAGVLKDVVERMQRWIVYDGNVRDVMKAVVKHAGQPGALMAIAQALEDKKVLDRFLDEMPDKERWSPRANAQAVLGLMRHRAPAKNVALIERLLTSGFLNSVTECEATAAYHVITALPASMQEELRRRDGGKWVRVLEKALPKAMVRSGAYGGVGGGRAAHAKAAGAASSGVGQQLIARCEKVRGAGEAVTLWRRLAGLDVGIRTTVVARVDALGALARMAELAGPANLSAGENRGATLAIAQVRDVVRVTGHVLALVERGGNERAYLALTFLRGLSQADMQWAVAQKVGKSTVLDKLKAQLGTRALEALQTNLYRGGKGGADRQAILTSLEDAALWTDASQQDRLEGVLRMAVAAGLGREAFDLSKTHKLHMRKAAAGMVERFRLYHPTQRAFFVAAEPGRGAGGAPRGGIVGALYGQRNKLSAKLSGDISSPGTLRGKGVDLQKIMPTQTIYGMAGVRLKERGKGDKTTNTADLEMQPQLGLLKLRVPSLSIAAMQQLFAGLQLKTGGGLMSDLRLDMQYPTKQRPNNPSAVKLTAKHVHFDQVLAVQAGAMQTLKRVSFDGVHAHAREKDAVTNLGKDQQQIGERFGFSLFGLIATGLATYKGRGDISGAVKQLRGSKTGKRLTVSFDTVKLAGLQLSDGTFVKDVTARGLKLDGGDNRSTYLLARADQLRPALKKAKEAGKTDQVAKLEATIAQLRRRAEASKALEAKRDALRKKYREQPSAFTSKDQQALRKLERQTVGGYALSLKSATAKGVRSAYGSAGSVAIGSVQAHGRSTAFVGGLVSAQLGVLGAAPMKPVGGGHVSVASVKVSDVRAYTGVPTVAAVRGVIAELTKKEAGGALGAGDAKRLAALRAVLPKVVRYEALEAQRKTAKGGLSAELARERARLEATLKAFAAVRVQALGIQGLQSGGGVDGKKAQRSVSVRSLTATGVSSLMKGTLARKVALKDVRASASTDQGGQMSLSVGQTVVDGARSEVGKLTDELLALTKKRVRTPADEKRLAEVRSRLKAFEGLTKQAASLQAELVAVNLRLRRRLRRSTRKKLVAKRTSLRDRLNAVRTRVAALSGQAGSLRLGKVSVKAKGLAGLVQPPAGKPRSCDVVISLKDAAWTGLNLARPSFSLKADTTALGGGVKATVGLTMSEDPKTKGTKLSKVTLKEVYVPEVSTTGLALKAPIGDELLEIALPKKATLTGLHAKGIPLTGFDLRTFPGYFHLEKARADVQAKLGSYFSAKTKLDVRGLGFATLKTGGISFGLDGASVHDLGFRKTGPAPKGSVVEKIRRLGGTIRRLGQLSASAHLDRKTGELDFTVGLDTVSLSKLALAGGGHSLYVGRGTLSGLHGMGRAQLDPAVVFDGKEGKALKSLRLDQVGIRRIAGSGIHLRTAGGKVKLGLRHGWISGIALKGLSLGSKAFDLRVRGAGMKDLSVTAAAQISKSLKLALNAKASGSVRGIHVARANNGKVTFGLAGGALSALKGDVKAGSHHYRVRGAGTLGKTSGHAHGDSFGLKTQGGSLALHAKQVGGGNQVGLKVGEAGGSFHMGRDGFRTRIGLGGIEVPKTTRWEAGDLRIDLRGGAQVPSLDATVSGKRTKGRDGKVAWRSVTLESFSMPTLDAVRPVIFYKDMKVWADKATLQNLWAKGLRFDLGTKMFSGGKAELDKVAVEGIQARIGKTIRWKGSLTIKDLWLKGFKNGKESYGLKSLRARAYAGKAKLGVAGTHLDTDAVTATRSKKGTQITAKRVRGAIAGKSLTVDRLPLAPASKASKGKAATHTYRWKMPLLGNLGGVVRVEPATYLSWYANALSLIGWKSAAVLQLAKQLATKVELRMKNGKVDGAAAGYSPSANFYKWLLVQQLELIPADVRKKLEGTLNKVPSGKAGPASPASPGLGLDPIELTKFVQSKLGGWDYWVGAALPEGDMCRRLLDEFCKDPKGRIMLLKYRQRILTLIRKTALTAKLSAKGDVTAERMPLSGGSWRPFLTIRDAKLGLTMPRSTLAKGLKGVGTLSAKSWTLNAGKVAVDASGMQTRATVKHRWTQAGQSKSGASLAFGSQTLKVWIAK